MKPVFWIALIILILILAGAFAVYFLINVVKKDNPNLHESVYKTAFSNLGTYYVDIRDYGFFPGNLTIKPGEMVIWENLGYNNHSVTFYSINVSSKLLQPGKNYTWIFDYEGVFNYSCPLYPDLKGRVIVDINKN